MSFLNGLSAAGGGLASVGAEMQKADVAKQLQEGQQTFAGGENEKNRQAAVSLQGNQQTFQTGLQNQKADLERQQAILADALARNSRVAELGEASRLRDQELTPEMKLLDALGVPGMRRGGAPSSTSSAAPQQAPGQSGSTGATPSSGSGVPDQTDNPLIAKALGIPQTGSEAAVRMAIARGIRTDPATKDLPPDQQAALLENKLAVAGAKIGSKDSLDSIAQQIASYDLSPLDARARMTAGGPDVMAKVKELNPKYNEANYAAIVEAKKAITPGGSLFVPISAMETSLGHASHFLDVASQLGNYGGGNWANIFPNKIASNVGAAPLVNALTQTAFAMAEEGNRIYAGNAGTEGAINNWVKSFPINGSLADQVAAVKNFAQLMGDKFDTMAYHLDKTFKDSGIPPVELLSPKGIATYQRLTSMGPDGKPPKSAGADTTAPKPPKVGEVQQGYSFQGGDPADPGSWKAVK